jgi:hypothetical protein
MVGRLIEERRLFGGSFRKLLALVVDVVVELTSLIPSNGIDLFRNCVFANVAHRELRSDCGCCTAAKLDMDFRCL